MRNEQVIEAWKNNRACKTMHLRTDGMNLWSYNMLIGKTSDGIKWSLDCKVSHTTNRHLSLASRVSFPVYPRILPYMGLYSRYVFPEGW